MDYKYIIIEGDNDYKCNSFQEVVRKLIDKDYYELSDKEKNEAISERLRELHPADATRLMVTDVERALGIG